MTFQEFFQRGGPVMYPLALCSVATLAIVIERFYSLRLKKVVSPAIIEVIKKINGDRGAVDALALCRNIGTPFARIMVRAIENRHLPRDENREVILFAGRQELTSLERGLVILEIVANVAPLLGLLGTVMGVVETFGGISLAGVGNPAVLSKGIAEALVATISGLVIAIPAFAAHSYFTKKVDDLVLEMEKHSTELLWNLYDSGNRR